MHLYGITQMQLQILNPKSSKCAMTCNKILYEYPPTELQFSSV